MFNSSWKINVFLTMKRTLSVPRTEDGRHNPNYPPYFESGGFKQSSILLVECGRQSVWPGPQAGTGQHQ